MLEAALLSTPAMFRLILIHELFHFAWLRLGNNLRQDFKTLLLQEWKNGAAGELGESSGVMKRRLRQAAESATPGLWRDYACESFCDTAACFYAGSGNDGLFTLRERWRKRREAWFQEIARRGPWKC